jgi:hypothetical protein
MHKINLAVLSNAATVAQKAICHVTIDQKLKRSTAILGLFNKKLLGDILHFWLIVVRRFDVWRKVAAPFKHFQKNSVNSQIIDEFLIRIIFLSVFLNLKKIGFLTK